MVSFIALQITDAESLALFVSRQRQLTITMGISGIFTLILYVIPVFVEILTMRSIWMWDIDNIAVAYAVISSNLNPIFNVAIIMMKQVDIAAAVRKTLCIFSCKTTRTIIVATHP
ncbi:unnamed protein product [Anisakis simplex]|uniref:G_PROTEIN_RECEP_F1_2 domain-containing protein n=1 Tax=Anisakis simplex TaxID=6269 RepID=A0A0M3JWA2_ANISI|nr:unnamed protein product [Anisakis simplex]